MLIKWGHLNIPHASKDETKLDMFAGVKHSSSTQKSVIYYTDKRFSRLGNTVVFITLLLTVSVFFTVC